MPEDKTLSGLKWFKANQAKYPNSTKISDLDSGFKSNVTAFNAGTPIAYQKAAQALAFQQAGCEWIHLVDLNGAFAGEPVNAAAVEAILAAITVPAQLGGGIRDMATIERWLSKGLAQAQ